ncbi:MAG TPA: hypothetical protein VJ817_12190 [Gemmatimonadales bacterium]|nr:hypothetical protein [Gemmatimonadales bacterium]
MAKRNPSSNGLGPIKARPTLTDRVKDRVAKIEAELERREGTPAPKTSKAKKRTPSLGSAATASKNGNGELETRSLNRVYGELKTTYQQYRKSTGRSAVPELREAVQAFKRGPSLTSLVGVAVFLDDRSLLTW